MRSIDGKARRQVLVADDDPVCRRMLRSVLSSWGYEVVEVSDGVTALERLEERDGPRLGIVDWVMPGIDGPELCRRIRALESDTYVYLLLLTVKTDRQHVIAGLDAGADDYLKKPFDPAEIEQRLRAGERILDMHDRLIEAQDVLRLKASVDSLTGTRNRGAIIENLEQECERRRRRMIRDLGVVLIDVDHFKQVNDSFGHPAGDKVLQNLAKVLAECVRPYDLVGRYGGDEFILVLPGANRSTVTRIAERLRLAAKSMGITVSLGVSAAGRNADPDALIASADAALFRAKADGRDCVRHSDPDEDFPEDE